MTDYCIYQMTGTGFSCLVCDGNHHLFSERICSYWYVLLPLLVKGSGPSIPMLRRSNGALVLISLRPAFGFGDGLLLVAQVSHTLSQTFA